MSDAKFKDQQESQVTKKHLLVLDQIVLIHILHIIMFIVEVQITVEEHALMGQVLFARTIQVVPVILAFIALQETIGLME